VRSREKKGKREKENGKREGVRDMCLCVSGWKEIMLSPPSQS
jgi:hypothetical protein